MKPGNSTPWQHVPGEKINPYWYPSQLRVGEQLVADLSCPDALGQGAANAAYIARAANAYAQLVSVLRAVVGAAQPVTVHMGEGDPFPVRFTRDVETARELLRELGEL